ncbi:MAG: hypothetical protein HUK14_01410 [Muribaculaceae bacterium]|nr:hypothetical protein [Muribaculaceae bacterium]
MKGAVLSIFLAALALTLFNACGTVGCMENTSSIPEAGFYVIDTLGKAQSLSMDSIRVYGIGAPGDSAIVKEGAVTKIVYLPLRSEHTSTSFCFSYKWKEFDEARFNDTLVFEYSAHPYLVSQECGASFRYKIKKLTATHHLIDSVVILDSMITNVDRETLKVYFRTDTIYY